MPAADDPGDAIAGLLGRRETHQHGARAFRLAQDAHRHLGDDAEQPLRAGHDAEQIIAAAVEVLAADAHDLAGHQHDLETQHIVAGDPVFEAMHAAGIFRHIAADGAGDLRGRVGRIVEAGGLDRLRDRQIGHAGLRHHHAVLQVDLADAVELGHAEQNAVGGRQRAAGQRRAGAARHHVDALRMAIFQHPAHLIDGVGQHHHHGQLAVGR